MVMMHPLLNPDSKHYDTGDKPTIWYIEKELTVKEMIGACKYNIAKYKARLGKKDNIEKEEKKIETYENYLKLLEEVPKKYRDNSVRRALTKIRTIVRYKEQQ